MRGSWFDREEGFVYAIEEGKWGRQDVVWKLKGVELGRLGVVNPRLQLFSRGVGQLHDLVDYTLWLGSHQTAIVRKGDGLALMTDEWNQKGFNVFGSDEGGGHVDVGGRWQSVASIHSK